MSYSTVRDILDFSEKLHRHTAALYEGLRDTTQRERVDMMLKLLSSHEQKLAEVTAAYRDETKGRVLDEWHQFEPADVGDLLDGAKESHADIAIEELVNIALKVDEYLIAAYRQFAADASSGKVRELFEDLAGLEQAEKISAVRAALSASDW